MESIRIEKDTLTAEECYKLRKKVSFLEYSIEDLTLALRDSLVTYKLVCNDITVGMVRVVGDDRVSFFIKDLIVLPQYQKKGCGKLLMNSVMDYIDKKGALNCYVGLMSTPGKESFYKKFGFIERPSREYRLGSGMVLFYDKK